MRLASCFVLLCLVTDSAFGQGGCPSLTFFRNECSKVEPVTCVNLLDEAFVAWCSDEDCDWSQIEGQWLCSTEHYQVQRKANTSADGMAPSFGPGHHQFQTTECVKCLERRRCTSCTQLSHLCAPPVFLTEFEDLEFPTWFKLTPVGSGCTSL